MIFCRFCGNRLPDDAAFCNKCGGKVALTSPYSPSSEMTTSLDRLSASPNQFQSTIPAWQSSQPSFSSPQPGGSQSSLILPPPPLSQPSIPPTWPIQPGTLQSTPMPQSSMSAWLPRQMPVAPPQPASALNAIQRLLVRIFKPALAGNALFGIIIGSVISIVLGTIIASLVIAITHAIAPSLTRFGSNGQDIMNYLVGIVPLHSLLRDSLQLLFIMHGAVVRVQYMSGSNISSYTYNATLNGLLFIPALALTLGGYIAASTDLQNHASRSLWRGAALAVPYAVLLIIMVPQVNGSISLFTGESSTDVNTLTIDIPSLFFFGLLWGALFGLFGASLKLSQVHWRSMVSNFLRTRPHPQIGAMITGGLAASGLGFALTFLVLLVVLAYSTYSVPLFKNNLCYYTLGYGDWQFMATWGIAQGPLHAMNLFFYSFGAPITINNPSQFGQSCLFYTHSTQVKLSMFGGSSHLPDWTYALLALPVISLFLGGRMSAALARSPGVGPGAIQGALIALPFTILMILLSVITSITIQTANPSGTSSLPSNIVQSLGVGAFDLALWALLGGAVLGALGGIYQTSALKTNIGKGIYILNAPLRLLAKPGFFFIDRLRGRPRAAPRTSALSLLYASVMSAILLAIVVGVAAAVLIGLNQTITPDLNYRIRDILGAMLIALPGLLLLSACVSALSEDPSLETQNTGPLFTGATLLPGTY